ncbi:XRE family transcriptional regulator [Yersinia enterocolitica]|nr:XRE family transcriptional regulator [Yersinia enterocolitica]
MPRLLINLKGKRGEFVQLYSRVAFALNIGNALPKDDVSAIAASVLPAVADDINEALYQESKGNARRLFKLLRGAIRLSHINETPVGIGAVRQAAKMLIN